MKRLARTILSLFLLLSLGASAFAEMSARESKRIAQGKITKNEAQHLVLRQYPRADIKKCELRQSKGHSFWAVDFIKQGEKTISRVKVDGRTGKMLP